MLHAIVLANLNIWNWWKRMTMFPWYYIPCPILENAEIYPFGLLSKTELCDLLWVDLPSQIESLPSFEIVSKLTNLPNLNSFDIDENLIQAINSKYYKVHDLAKLNTDNRSNNFSMFHVNTRSLTKHFGQLYSLICATKIPFDVIGLTETKQPLIKTFFQMSTLMDISYILNLPKIYVVALLFM